MTEKPQFLSPDDLINEAARLQHEAQQIEAKRGVGEDLNAIQLRAMAEELRIKASQAADKEFAGL